MSDSAAPPRIFSAVIRSAKRQRAQAIGPIHAHFLVEYLAEELAERLAFVARDFRRVAVVGPIAGLSTRFELHGAEIDHFAYSIGEIGTPLAAEGLVESLAGGGDVREGMGRYDLILCAPMLESANDIPGVLTQFRLALKPDGLFLGAMFGHGSLPTLRAAMQAADDDRGVARIHPQVDLRSLGDLMQRAGFALPVVDEEQLTLTYADALKALADLRALGQGNALATQTLLKGKGAVSRALSAWAGRSDAEGRVAEYVTVAFMSGWAPSPDQPKAARRGSATVSLADALNAGRKPA